MTGVRRRFAQGRGAVLGTGVLGAILLVVWVGPLLIDVDPNRQDLALGPTAPDATHPFGTDYEGRDLLARTLHGGRISFLVGFVATLVSLVIGVTWGAVAGWYGGRLGTVMMQIVDVLYGLPYMFFVIVLMVWFGRSLVHVFIGLGAVSWLTMARIVRAEVLVLRKREYVLAARVAGVSTPAILWRHVVPNAIGPIIVYAALTVPHVMVEEAFLSFLGLGIRPPDASWGSLLSEGASLWREYPWMLLAPGVLLTSSLLALNLIADGLRDALDVRSEDR